MTSEPGAWTDAPQWDKLGSVAEREQGDCESFSPPSAAQAAACALSAGARMLAEAAAQAGILDVDLLVLSGLRAPDPFAALRCYRVLGLGGRSLPFAAGAGARASTRVVCVLPALRGAALGWLQEAARAGHDITVLAHNGGGCRDGAAAWDPGLVEAALRAGAGFVARVLPGAEDSAPILSRALRHKGLAVVDAVGLCPSHDGAKEHADILRDARRLDAMAHDPGDYQSALARAAGPSNIGVFFDAPNTRPGAPPAFPQCAPLSAAQHEALWSALR